MQTPSPVPALASVANYVRDFAPGDVVYRDRRYYPTERYVVQSPTRTSRGMLRLKEDGSDKIVTKSWSHPSTGYRLPQGYRLEEK